MAGSRARDPVGDRPREVRQIVFGVSAHGLGHLTRICEVANALVDLDPTIRVHLWTDIARDRVASDLRTDFEYRRVSYEPGTAHRNCFEIDRARTVEDYRLFWDEREGRLETEREALRAIACDAVICDIPALLLRAAAEVGIAGIGVSNFTWDWILEPILVGTSAEPMLALLRDDYARATHHIRLPFGPSESVISSNEPGPLVSRQATLPVERVRAQLGLDVTSRRPLALVCPGGWSASDWEHIEPDAEDFDLILVGDLPVTRRGNDVALPHDLPPPIRFPDLVNAADIVLAKPGYGIASECVRHRTPLVSIERPEFRETPLLIAELHRLGPSGNMSLESFFGGRWSRIFRETLAGETPWAPLAARPARTIAQRIQSILAGDRGGEPSVKTRP